MRRMIILGPVTHWSYPLVAFENRGFRQSTRGPDTGAFQHSYFRRDRPELCLQMVCQRTSAGAEKKKRNTPEQINKSRLPAKKRHVVLTKESLEAMMEEQNKSQAPTQASVSTIHEPATISEDSLSNASDHLNNKASLLGRGITNDTALAQKALAIRNEEERTRVARTMLYDAYQRALRGER